jgi:hypothetical protein
VVAIGLDPAIPEYLRDAAVCRIEPGIHNLEGSACFQCVRDFLMPVQALARWQIAREPESYLRLNEE